MQNWFQDDLQVNGLRLRYYRSGGSRPPLVLVHGFTDNALYWTRTAEALAADWDVVAYDSRGHGASDRAGGRFGDAERVGDLMGVIHVLGLEKPALVGHSMGAATIALAAAEVPALPRCLVLEDPAWYEPDVDETPEQSATRNARVAEWRPWIETLQANTHESGMAEMRQRSPGWSPLDQALSLNARRQVEPDLFEYYPMVSSPWRALLPRIECPILLLMGEDRQRGAIITPEQAQDAARLWRQGRWAVIPGAGHSIRYDHFDAYLDVVQTFLRAMLPDNPP